MQIHALRARAHAMHTHVYTWRTPAIRISYIALVNDKHVEGKQSRITVSIILNRVELILVLSIV